VLPYGDVPAEIGAQAEQLRAAATALALMAPRVEALIVGDDEESGHHQDDLPQADR
jgi:hypothetical protein